MAGVQSDARLISSWMRKRKLTKRGILPSEIFIFDERIKIKRNDFAIY